MGALIPLALSIAPDLAKWLSGDTAETTVAAITQAILSVTGTSDPTSVSTAIERDPGTAVQVRLQLAQIAASHERAASAADMTTLTTALRDTINTSRSNDSPADEKLAAAWSAPVISAIVLVTFAAVMTLVLTSGVPSGSETMANMLLGTLAAMATSVVSYWVGSSAGSARKEAQIAQTARAAAAN